MKKKIINAWYPGVLKLNEILHWCKTNKNGFVLKAPYIHEGCKLKRKALESFGESIKKIRITLEEL